MSFDGEKENHLVFDVRFLATNEQANAVWLAINGLPEWRDYDILDSMLRFGRWVLGHASDPVGDLRREFERLCRRHSELRSKLVAATIGIVANVTRE